MNSDKMVSVPFKALRDFLEHSACTYKGPEWTKNKAALRHAMSKGLVIQKDWVLVPVNPTREMVLAGHEAYKNAPCDEALIIYSTMLGCAPDAPGDVTREMNDELADLRARLAELLDALKGMTSMYGYCWDLVDGGLLCMQDNVQRFEDAHEAAQKVVAAMSKAPLANPGQ